MKMFLDRLLSKFCYDGFWWFPEQKTDKFFRKQTDEFFGRLAFDPESGITLYKNISNGIPFSCYNSDGLKLKKAVYVSQFIFFGCHFENEDHLTFKKARFSFQYPEILNAFKVLNYNLKHVCSGESTRKREENKISYSIHNNKVFFMPKRANRNNRI